MPILNQKFYDNLDKKIDALPSEEEAKKFIEQAFKPIEKQTKDVIDKVYKPLETLITAYTGEANLLLALMDAPTDPMKVIPWVNKVVDAATARLNLIKVQVSPLVKQYDTAQQLVNGLPSEVQKLQQHLGEKAQEKGWNIDIPGVPMPDLPVLPPIPDILK